ncbi:MAG TPA: YebC/PmpR family DNA-binding transcriptional regulator [Coxiellaceae bacterium]|nr:YebC/PmpR family DNA-binding transcriptional regulator [Coxiellaceae bacterium]
MAGHSKWKNIQHRKGAQDAKRGKIFTKFIREITTAARIGGGDESTNPRLRLAVQKALSENMTRDTINRAIKRGAGGEDDSNMMEVIYEGYGPDGVAVMVECLTDNKNRTVSDVRFAFTKCGGNLGTNGSVAYLFSKIGFIQCDKTADEEKIMTIAIDAGADDITTHADGSVDVVTTPDHFEVVKKALTDAKIPILQAEITMHASTQCAITDEEQAAKMIKLTDILEDLDDVQHVYSNADIAEAILEKL